jgi:hypothetical protein
MTETSEIPADVVPTYLGRGDPALSGYRPTWVANLAPDASLEGSLLDGVVEGADAVRTVIGAARGLYDRQDFSHVGPWGADAFIEDYTAEVRGVPVGAVHLISFNADGEAQRIVVNYRPLSALMTFSRLLRQELAGTPYAEHYLDGEV